MGFTHQLATFGLDNHPFHVLGDCDDPEGRGMAIGGLPQLLHHANEVLIVPGNEFPVGLVVDGPAGETAATAINCISPCAWHRKGL